jgi:hypothetical protein
MTVIDMPKPGSVYWGAITGLARRRSASALPGEAFHVADVGVDAAALAAYERVCGFTSTETVPATYLHVLAFPISMHLMNSPAFPFRAIGLVHIANTITQVRPVARAERVTFAVSAGNLREHDRGRQFDVFAVGAVDGIEVWRGVSTYLRRTTSATPDRSPATSGLSSTASGDSSPAETPPPDAIWEVGRDVGTAYARVSGDRNPIHVSKLGAKAFGFNRPIAHGMWSAARCLAAVVDGVPEAYTYAVGFKRPIPLPSTVAFAHRGPEITLTSAANGAPHLSAILT